LIIGDYIVGTHIPEGEYMVKPDVYASIIVYGDGGLKAIEFLVADDNDAIESLNTMHTT
jgi:hypothetical protein